MNEQYRVMVAQFPGGNSTHPDAAGWVTKTALEMHQDYRVSTVIPWRMADTPITMCRNRCVRDALKHKVDYLLMIDSDMTPDLPEPGAKPFWKTAWEFMMSRRVQEGRADPAPKPATIAAPYCGPPPDESVYVFQWTSGETCQTGNFHDQRFALRMIPREQAALYTGIEEVPALPTGLILYDMRVFETLPKPWFAYEWTDEFESDKATTEDVYQTRNASLLGFPQFVAWDCWAGHNKPKLVGKPRILGIEAMNAGLRAAMVRGLESGHRLVKVDKKPIGELLPARQ